MRVTEQEEVKPEHRDLCKKEERKRGKRKIIIREKERKHRQS